MVQLREACGGHTGCTLEVTSPPGELLHLRTHPLLRYVISSTDSVTFKLPKQQGISFIVVELFTQKQCFSWGKIFKLWILNLFDNLFTITISCDYLIELCIEFMIWFQNGFCSCLLFCSIKLCFLLGRQHCDSHNYKRCHHRQIYHWDHYQERHHHHQWK